MTWLRSHTGLCRQPCPEIRSRTPAQDSSHFENDNGHLHSIHVPPTIHQGNINIESAITVGSRNCPF